jgi:tetratricopeptide (TPR) repeat protein
MNQDISFRSLAMSCVAVTLMTLTINPPTVLAAATDAGKPAAVPQHDYLTQAEQAVRKGIDQAASPDPFDGMLLAGEYVRCLMTRGDVRRARAFIETLPEGPARQSGEDAMFEEALTRGEWELAKKRLASAAGEEPDISGYLGAKLVEALLAANQREEAKTETRRLEKLIGRADPVRQAALLRTLAEPWLKRGDLPMVKQITQPAIDRLKNRTLKPGEDVSFRDDAEFFVRLGDFENATNLIRRIGDVQYRNQAWHLASRELIAQGNLNRAVECFDNMTDDDRIMLGVELVGALITNRQPGRAEVIRDRTEKIIETSAAKIGNAEIAAQAIDQQKALLLFAKASGQAQTGAIEECLETVNSVTNRTMRERMQTLLVRQLTESGQLNAAEGLLKQGAFPDPDHSAHLFVAVGWAKKRELARATKLVKEAGQPISPWIAQELVGEFVNAGDLTGARMVARKVDPAPDESKWGGKSWTRWQMHLALARAELKTGSTNNAIESLHSAVAEFRRTENSNKFLSAIPMVEVSVQCGEIEEAISLARELQKDPRAIASAFQTMGKLLTAQNKPDRLEQLLTNETNLVLRARLLIGAAQVEQP